MNLTGNGDVMKRCFFIFLTSLFLFISCIRGDGRLNQNSTENSVITLEQPLVTFQDTEHIPVLDEITTEQFVSIDLSGDFSLYIELRNHFDGGVKVGYIRGKDFSISIPQRSLGSQIVMNYFILEQMTFYGIKDNIAYMLGYITANGVYDKDSNLLKGATPTSALINLGLSSSTFDHPFSPIFAFQNQNNEIFNSEALTALWVDLTNHTLMLYISDWSE